MYHVIQFLSFEIINLNPIKNDIISTTVQFITNSPKLYAYSFVKASIVFKFRLEKSTTYLKATLKLNEILLQVTFQDTKIVIIS